MGFDFKEPEPPICETCGEPIKTSASYIDENANKHHTNCKTE